METLILKINSAESAAAIQKLVATLPDVEITEHAETHSLPALESKLDSPEQEITDVFKSTTPNKAWMPGPVFTAAELAERIQQATDEIKSGNVITLKETQRFIEQLKAFHTHGS